MFSALKSENSLKMLPKKINPNPTIPQFSIWSDKDSTNAFTLNNNYKFVFTVITLMRMYL